MNGQRPNFGHILPQYMKTPTGCDPLFSCRGLGFHHHEISYIFKQILRPPMKHQIRVGTVVDQTQKLFYIGNPSRSDAESVQTRVNIQAFLSISSLKAGILLHLLVHYLHCEIYQPRLYR